MKRENIEINNIELDIQLSIINELKEENKGRELEFYIETFGCAMNENDSEKLMGILEEIGYKETKDINAADFIIYNTCCVRENAENKIYPRIGNLLNLKAKNLNLITAICGCMMQQEHVVETLSTKYKKNIDIVFGTHNIYKIAELIRDYKAANSQIVDIWNDYKEIVEQLPKDRKHKFKSLINITYGCNNFCTYCIVPYVRGRERSRRSEDIINEIKVLVADGVKEIMLLGQNVNSYGLGLDEEINFAKLLRKINEVNGLERIRFMTPHPKDFTDEVIYAIRDCDKVCNYVHLPIQSGSTKILEDMNRKYTKEQYLELVAKLKREIPDVSLTTDIIVGFPGEKEEDVLDTIDVVKKVEYAGAFTYIYSKRTGTKAATMENQVSEEIVKKHFDMVLSAVNEAQMTNNEKTLGKTYKVLAEEIDNGVLTGRTEYNTLVHFEGDASLIGEIIDVKIVEINGHYLKGQLISKS